jgi:hypothetical protein
VVFGPAADAVVGLRSVLFFVDGVLVNSDATAPYDLLGSRRDGTPVALDTRLLRNGRHRISAVVLLAGGLSLSYTADVQVRN